MDGRNKSQLEPMNITIPVGLISEVMNPNGFFYAFSFRRVLIVRQGKNVINVIIKA